MPTAAWSKKAEGGTVTRTDTDCTGSIVTALAYDGLNRLTQVTKTDLPAETYAYDDQGRRIQKTPPAPSPATATPAANPTPPD